MLDDLSLMQNAAALARHATARQALVARNIAHADTPGFKAMDLPPFASVVDAGDAAPLRIASGLRATRAGHLRPDTAGAAASAIERPGRPAPNGNTVSLEIEMMTGAEIRKAHDLALAVWGAGRDLLRASLGKR